MNILIVKLGAISDVMFATPLVEAVKTLVDDPVIDWLVGSHAEPILRGYPGLRKRIVYDRLLSGGLYGWAMSLGRLIRLWRSNYELVFLLERGPAAQVMAGLTESPVRVGFEGHLARMCLTHTIPFGTGIHETERYLNLLRGLGYEVASPPMHLGLTEEAQVVVELLLDEEEVEPPYIAVVPGGGRNPFTTTLIKRWMPESYAAVAHGLAERGTVIVVGSPDEAEACELVAKAAGPRAVNTCGRLNQPQMAAMLARCAVVVTNDSGPLHIAAAVHTPTVSIFGPTDPRLRAPLGDMHRYLWRPPPCGPCALPEQVGRRHNWDCTRRGDELACLRAVTPELVLQAVDETLAGIPWPGHEPFWRD
ncbi:MAG: glycosyltransferase family 9 protein [Armatimonadetes bacterium]|nr:glycosyltransferase family 9 protein [Armatimonadota bacterium]